MMTRSGNEDHTAAPADVVFSLTNACGDDTGSGTLRLTPVDCAKVAFEGGPGHVLSYIIEIERQNLCSAS
jgi:hypothetical protein